MSTGSSIKLFVAIYRLLPQYSDVGDRTVYSRCTVYVLLKHLTQQVAHGLSNDNAPSTITQGETGKIQGGALQVYGRGGRRLKYHTTRSGHMTGAMSMLLGVWESYKDDKKKSKLKADDFDQIS